MLFILFFFFKQKTAYEIYQCDWSSDVCSSDLKKKYFTKTNASSASLAASDELKKLITFRPLNLVKPWPLSGAFDIVFCRNVVIYFQEETQQELWSRFHNAIKPNGWLFIGHSERITGPASPLFKPEGFTTYQKIEKSA